MNKNLSMMLKLNEPVDSMFRAAKGACGGKIAMAQMAMSQQLTSTPGANSPALAIMMSQKIEDGLYGYTMRFKAAGGPPGDP